MGTKPDIRSYCNPWPPRFSQAIQEAQLTGVIYVEDKSGKIIDALIQSVRKGSVVEVVEIGLLAPVKGRPAKRRALMAERIERIKERGGSIVELATGWQSAKGQLPRMMVRGAEFIASSGRAAPKRERSGRPDLETTMGLTAHDLVVAEGVWTSRRYKNDDARVTEIEKRIGKKLKRGWLWDRFGSPSRQKDDNKR